MIQRLLLALLVTPLLIAGAEVSPKARELHRDAFVFDGHVHVINRQLYLGGDIGQRYTDGQVDLPRMKEGGIDALLFTLFVQEQYYPPRYETRQFMRLLDLAYSQIEKNKDAIELAVNPEDIRRINGAGKIAAVIDLEGSFDLDGDLGLLRAFRRLGLRAIEIAAHNWANNYADSCCAPHKYQGLNEHGRAFVRELNRLGILINVSHASDETIEDVLEVSTQPLVATHHGLRSLNDIPRNMPESLLKKMAAKGGVIGFHIGNEFHNRKQFEWRTKNTGKAFWDTSDIAARKAQLSILEIDKLVAREYPMVGVNSPDDVMFDLDGWFEVVDRAIAVAGEDHVALGTDFDGGPTPPKGVRDISDLPMLTQAMLRRGYSEQRIRKFLGGNLLRVFEHVTRGR